jgi:peroxiredoxin
MPKNFTSFLFILIVSILFIEIQAQTIQSDSIKNEATVLQGLKKAEPGDIKPGTPLMLDPMSTPMYDEQLQKINPADFMKIMISNEYLPEPYLDEKKNVKAFVMRKATPEEKAMMAKMQQGGMGMEQEKNEWIGTKATDFSLENIKGKKYTLSELSGKVVVLNFWFIACQPCIMEMPELNELVEEFKEKEVVFLAIALNTKKELKKFLKKNKFNYSIIADGQAIAQTYQIKGYPTNIIIDKSGVIHYVSTGVGPNNKENLQKAINQLLPN